MGGTYGDEAEIKRLAASDVWKADTTSGF